MSESEDERLPDVPAAPRQKRFRFKTFAERVSEVEVDVYRRLGAVKSEPSSGSWLADGLAQWRELNSAAHFLQAAGELHPLCQSLPQLLHHREAIAGILLSSLEPAARLSLPALLDLLAALARDLQHQFLPLLPRVVRRLVQLLQGGAEREPESLEAVFTCVSQICKHLVRHLAADLPAALRVTAPLRYHRADYVRQFAAQAVGFLLRSAPSAAALRAGVRAVLAEQAARPSLERTDGAGLVLAEAVLGVSHGLHSRAPQVLQLLLKEDLLQPADLRPTASAADGKHQPLEAEAGGGEALATAGAAVAAAAAAAAISQEQLRARAAAVARVALDRLLDHIRRGKGEELWSALLAETHARLRGFEQATAGVGAAAGAAAAAAAAGRSLGRALLLVAQAVGYFRGSRVESYKPLMDLLGRLMQPAVWLPTAATADTCSPTSDSPVTTPSPSPSPRQAAAAPRDAAADAAGGGDEDDVYGDLLGVSLSYAVLELVRGVVHGHLKAVGASGGPEVLARCASAWAPCFSRPPAAEALPFVKALMVPPAGAEIARLFAPQMMGCLGRFVMLRQHDPRPEQRQQQQQPEQQQQEECAGSALLLLRDLCALLRPSDDAASGTSRPAGGLPLLLTAQPHGVRLAAHVRALATDWRPEAAAADPRVCAKTWAAVSLLPHACENELQTVTICEQVLETASSALKDRSLTQHHPHAEERSEGDLLLLRATAAELLAELLQRQQHSGLSVSLVAVAEATLEWVRDRLYCTMGTTYHDHLHHPPRPEPEGSTQVEADASADADFASIRAAGSLMAAVRASVSAAAAGGGGGAVGAGAIADIARGLLSESRLRQLVPRLAPLLSLGSQPLRAAVLRLLCCFDQPHLETLNADGDSEPAAAVADNPASSKKQRKDQQQRQARAAASTAPRCDLLEVLYGINSQPFTIESGRKWAVAMGRLKTYLEYNRIPEFLVPAFAYGMVGVLYIRFSPLWQPASQALAACLQFRAQVTWPIVFAFLKSSQAELISGRVASATAGSAAAPVAAGGRRRGSGRHRSGAALSAAITAMPVMQELPLSQDASRIETLEERYGAAVRAGTPQAAGGVTDPQNRLSHVLRAMAAAPYSTIEQYSRDWVPLFLEYTAARGSHFDDGEGDVEATVAAARAATAQQLQQSQPTTGVPAAEAAVRPRKKARMGAGSAPADVARGPMSVAALGADEDEGIRERRESHAAAGCSAADADIIPGSGSKRKRGKKAAAKAPAAVAAAADASAGGTSPSAAAAAAAATEAAAAATEAPAAATEAAVTSARGNVRPAVAAAGGTGVSVLSRIGGKTWRAGLLDWLKLLAGLRGVRGLYRSEELQRAVSSHLLEAESGIQVAALRCLRPYRFRWLPVEMADRLGRLADDSTLREELAIFPLAPGADGGVGEEARPGLVPLLIRVLFPKMRKRSGRLGGRGAPGSARAAILNFLANLRPSELRPLLELLLEPMAAAFAEPPVAPVPALRDGGAAAEAEAAEVDRYRLLPPPWWSAPMLGRSVAWWLAAVDQGALDALPARRKVGFLNAFEDLLSHLGHSLEPFLPVMLAITLRLLTAATAAITAGSSTGTGGEGDARVEAAGQQVAGDKSEPESGSESGSESDPEEEVEEAGDGDDSGGDDGAEDARNGRAGASAGRAAASRKAAKRGLGGSSGEPIAGGSDSAGPGSAAGDRGEEEKEEVSGGSEDGDVAAVTIGGDGAADAAGAAAADALPPLERHREVRSTALRLLAQVWLRFPASTSADYNQLWGVFLSAVQPLIPRLQFEAASSKEPPLLECVLSLSLSPGLARVLGDMGSVPDATLSLVRPASSVATAAAAVAAAARDGGGVVRLDGGDDAGPDGDADPRLDAPREEWQELGLGSALVRGVVAMLSSGRCTEVVRATVLDVLDAVLGCGEHLLRRVLLPWLPDVLRALHVVIAESWQQGGGGGRGPARSRRRAAGSTAHRELAILERLGGFVSDSELARSLADSLVALLTQAGARSLRQRSAGKSGRLDEGGISRALGALAALWGRLRLGDLPEEAVERYCESMSMWAIRLTGREARAQLAAAYGAVARLLPRMTAPAALLADLTSWSSTSLDELDYDRRLAAYGKLTAGAWGEMDRLQALPLLLTALYDLRNATDLALRQSASTALDYLVTALSAAEAAADGAPAAAGVVAERGSFTDPPNSLLRLTGRVLYPQIKSQLCSSSLAVRQEHLTLLRALVVALPRRFSDLTGLLSEDQETDFFHNVAHLQSHRRTRALTKLTKLLKAQAGAAGAAAASAADAAAAPPPPPLGRCLMDVIAPLLQQFIEEGSGGAADSSRAHDKKQSDLDKEANVTDAAVTALGAVAATLAWPQYEQLLNQFMRLMRARPAKPLIRAVCAILDNFHFKLPQPADGAEGMGVQVQAAAAARRKAVAAVLDGEESEEEHGGTEYDAAAEAVAVQRSLLVRILPALHEQLVERRRGEDEEAASVRAPVALALVKLLKLLPPAAERAELPRALQGVANLLRCRFQRIRDDARAVLVSMMAELGPRYLPYACHVLRASLPDRGFTAHVIGYTLHAVLEAVVKVAHGESAAAAAAAAVAEPAGGDDSAGGAVVPSGYDMDESDEEGRDGGGAAEEEGGTGVLDESLELCLPLIEADLFGQVSEAKEVTAFAMQYKEAKRCRANEAYQLLASGITFATHMRLLLSLVTDRLHLAGQPSIRAKLVQLLQFAARGVRANPTAGPKQILALVVGIMDGCLTREEAARARAKAAVGPAVSAAAGLAPAAAAAAAAGDAPGDAAAERAALHETLVLEFCLTLLHSGVKRGALAGRSPELMALLDPTLPLLVRSLRSRHAGCVSLALRTLAHIVPLPLSSMATAAPAAGGALTALLKKVPNTRHPIAQECFRLLAALLRDCEAYQPTTAQLRFLLRWAFEDLGEAGAQPTAFALLRGLLGRRVVVPEVYDVMDRVQQILVRSQAAPVRAACGVALLQFLLDFPLGPQRLRQHVGFLLANLEYEYESGRLAVLDMLGQVVAKFPAEVLQAQADVLLMPLVVRLVGDTSHKARAAAGDVLRALLRRLEAAQLEKAVSYCRAWLERGGAGGGGGGSAQDAALRRAAAQTLGFLAEVEGAKFGRRFVEVAPAVLRILERQVARGVDGEDDDPAAAAAAAHNDESAAAEAACPGWQEAYYCLLLLEKVAAQAAAALAWPTGRQRDAGGGQSQAQPPSPLAPALWEAVVRLLLHRHMWVRKAAARLVGYGLAAPRVCGGMMAARRGRAGQLAFAFFLQLECEAADEATCLQAVKCLVNLSVHLHRESDEGQEKNQQQQDVKGEEPNGTHVGEQAQQRKRQRAASKAERGPVMGHGSLHRDAANGHGHLDDADGESPVDEREGDAGSEEEEDDGSDEGGKDVVNGKAANGVDAAEEPQSDGAEEEEADGGEEGAGGGAVAAVEEEADDEGDDVSMAAQIQRRAFTLRGLVRRMARLADDARWARARQRAAAMRWIAAAASALGATAIAPHLPVLLRPLYRISEAAAAASAGRHSGIAAAATASGSLVSEEVRQLAEEVMAHLRGLVGSEVLLASYNTAREHVRGLRAQRKRRTVMRGMVDPAAAAAARLRHNARKAEGRKRKLEVLKRERSATQLRQGGRRGGGGKRARGG